MSRRRSKIFQGIDASPGIHIGLAHLVDRRRVYIPKTHVPEHEIAEQVGRFHEAVEKSIRQLERVQHKMSLRDGHEPGAIIEAHMMMMRDEMLLAGTERLIRKESINAEWALRKVVAEIRQAFDAIEDDYFRERRSDVEFVGDRILRNLLGQEIDLRVPQNEQAVLVAHDLSPADTAGLGKDKVAAFVTEVGGKTSHTAIVARALEIPAVVGAGGILSVLGTGDRVIVDGYRGQVVINPSDSMVRDALVRSQGLRSQVARIVDEEAEAGDGKQLRLAANIEMVEEVGTAIRYGAEGIGLFRTEYLFMGSRAPSEGFQRRCYEHILQRMYPRPATIRTMDLGGDKAHRLFKTEPEPNPALGLRSIRLSLRNRTLFLTQLRAMLRASVAGSLKILVPMISCQREIREARALLEEAKEQLRAKDQPFDERVEFGMMVEVPSAAVMASLFATHVDFFSIGTNDLIQYTLAVDRQNEQVAYLYNPLHIAVLRLISQVIKDAHKAGIWVSMCGEMAGDPLMVPILLGLGLDEISMNPLALPYIRHLIRHSNLKESRDLTRHILMQADSEANNRDVKAWMAERFPDFFTLDGHTDLLGGL